jgi:hypothetical protein
VLIKVAVFLYKKKQTNKQIKSNKQTKQKIKNKKTKNKNKKNKNNSKTNSYDDISSFVPIQGQIQDFELGGTHLKKLRRAEGGAKIFGVFRVKNHDFTPKKFKTSFGIESYLFKLSGPKKCWLTKLCRCTFNCQLTLEGRLAKHSKTYRSVL